MNALQISHLINNIINGQHGKKIAVILNEFGEEIGVERAMINEGDGGALVEEWVELANGCVCCTVKHSLVQALEQLVQRKDRIDHILLETTGLADPAPLASVLWLDDQLESAVRLDSIITVSLIPVIASRFVYYDCGPAEVRALVEGSAKVRRQSVVRRKSDVTWWSDGSLGVTWGFERSPALVGGSAEVQVLVGGLVEVRCQLVVRQKSGCHLVVRRKSGRHSGVRQKSSVRWWSGGSPGVTRGFDISPTSDGDPAEVLASAGGPAEVRVSVGGPAEVWCQSVVRRKSDISRWSGGRPASVSGPMEVQASVGGPSKVRRQSVVQQKSRRWSRSSQVVDAKNIRFQLQEYRDSASFPEAFLQIAFADVVILNKVDLFVLENKGGDLITDGLEDLQKEILSINSLASVLQAVRCQIDLHKILDRKAYGANHLAHLEALLEDSKTAPVSSRHDYSVRTLCIYEELPVDLNKVFLEISMMNAYANQNNLWTGLAWTDNCLWDVEQGSAPNDARPLWGGGVQQWNFPGKFIVVEELPKELLEAKPNVTISETKEASGGQGRGGNPNSFRRGKNQEVKILEGEDGMPPLEPIFMDEMSIGYERRSAYFARRGVDYECSGAKFERRGNFEEGFSKGNSYFIQALPNSIHIFGFGFHVRLWLEDLLWEKKSHMDVYRCKGVLNVHDSNQLHTLQAVREIYEVVPARQWHETEQKMNKIVFIGMPQN
ncbi:hypothetical protein M5K25_004433 [Dendrobium thyrsiflorum]|uniref:CobW C-terminal domain-containing protein n=1 Tax=Dendrobium thyrsiflorum TaxID=117978 RepID=A0ABD0VTM3_DENTH